MATHCPYAEDEDGANPVSALLLGDCGLSVGPSGEVTRQFEVRLSEAARSELRALDAEERTWISVRVWFVEEPDGRCTRAGAVENAFVRLRSAAGESSAVLGPVSRPTEAWLTLPVLDSCAADGPCNEDFSLLVRTVESASIAWSVILKTHARIPSAERPLLSQDDFTVSLLE